MPRRKSEPTEAPAALAVASPVLPADERPRHRRLAESLLAVLAPLPNQEALARLAALWLETPHGTARRAIRAAAITLLHQDAPAPVISGPVIADPEPAPPAPKPAPQRAGALTSLALEDAARMLLATTEDEDTPPPVSADALATLMSLDDVPDEPAPSPATKKRKAKGDDDTFRPLPPPPVDDLSALVDLMESDAPAAPPATKPRRAKPKAMDAGLAEQLLSLTDDLAPAPAPLKVDLGAAFAEMEDDPPTPAAKPAFDLSAQFAAMEKDAD